MLFYFVSKESLFMLRLRVCSLIQLNLMFTIPSIPNFVSLAISECPNYIDVTGQNRNKKGLLKKLVLQMRYTMA